MDVLPYLTPDVPAVPGLIKRHYEDFCVEEIPAYDLCGSGDHCFFRIEKRGLATMWAVQDIARALDVPKGSVGMAGLKDARSVSVQWLSVEHVDPARITALAIPRIRVLEVVRHTNKLKIGHLRGNRFRIRLRETDVERLPDVRAVCDVLGRRGAPNYFGGQRFGSRGDTWELGRAVLRREFETVMDLLLGRPGPDDTGSVLKARKLYESGDFEGAARAWPNGFAANARACRMIAKERGNRRRAYYALDQKLKKFYVNAYQSQLFNQVLAQRINGIDRVMTGDVACREDSGAAFTVEDAAVEQPRVEAFEISPTGPLFGFKMRAATGEPGAIEQAVLDAAGLSLDEFRKPGPAKVKGSRRPLRFRPAGLTCEAGQDKSGDYIELSFSLPSGCYATMLLREICKEGLREGRSDDAGHVGEEAVAVEAGAGGEEDGE